MNKDMKAVPCINMFARNLLFITLAAGFAGGKPSWHGNNGNGNLDPINGILPAQGRRGSTLQLSCPSQMILLDASSGSGEAGKANRTLSGGCVPSDSDPTCPMMFDLPEWILRDCNLKQRCSIAANSILNNDARFADMNFVMIKYSCIKSKPVYDIFLPITIKVSTAYLISYGYPNMPYVDDVTSDCECTGSMGKFIPFDYRLLDIDLLGSKRQGYNCDPKQTLEIKNKQGSSIYSCENQGAGLKVLKKILPKGKDTIEILFENDLERKGGRFILEYVHNDASFELNCNPDRPMPPTLPPPPTTTTITPPTTTTSATTTELLLITTTKPPSTSTTPALTTSTIPAVTASTTQLTATTTTTAPTKAPTSTKHASQTAASPQTSTKATHTETTTLQSTTLLARGISTAAGMVPGDTTTTGMPDALGAKSPSRGSNIGLIIGVIVAVIVIALVTILLVFVVKKKRSNLSRKLSQVDLVENDAAINVDDPNTTLQTTFNTYSLEADDDGSKAAVGQTKDHADAAGNDYTISYPNGQNLDSGEVYSVIDNMNIHLKVSPAGFETESGSGARGEGLNHFPQHDPYKKQTAASSSKMNNSGETTSTSRYETLQLDQNDTPVSESLKRGQNVSNIPLANPSDTLTNAPVYASVGKKTRGNPKIGPHGQIGKSTTCTSGDGNGGNLLSTGNFYSLEQQPVARPAAGLESQASSSVTNEYSLENEPAVTGLTQRVDNEYSLENPPNVSSQQPSQASSRLGPIPKSDVYCFDGTEPPSEVYHTVDDIHEENVPSQYSLEEGALPEENMYLDLIPDPAGRPTTTNPNAEGQEIGRAQGNLANQKLDDAYKLYLVPKTGLALGPVDWNSSHEAEEDKGKADMDATYTYAYSHFPNHKGEVAKNRAGKKFTGSPKEGAPKLGKGGDTVTVPEYALYDAGATYASADDVGSNLTDLPKGGAPQLREGGDTVPEPEYAVYNAGATYASADDASSNLTDLPKGGAPQLQEGGDTVTEPEYAVYDAGATYAFVDGDNEEYSCVGDIQGP